MNIHDKYTIILNVIYGCHQVFILARLVTTDMVYPHSAGIDFRRQILTSKVGLRAERVEIVITVADP